MKRYIFFTCTVFGIGGGQRYASNKAEYMQKKGYEVASISSYPMPKHTPLFYSGFRGKKNITITEIRNSPDSYPTKKRERILQKTIELLDCKKEDEIVIESNDFLCGLWAERIAAQLNAKHIVFSISEHNLFDEYTRDFLEFKFKRGELSTITVNSFRNLIEKSEIITEENLPILTAFLGDPIEDISDDRLEHFEKSDCNICVIGRGDKRYVEYSCEELVRFCQNHPQKTFSIALASKFKNAALKKKIKNLFSSVDNARVYYWGYFMPFPRSFFELFDLYIGGAGCATLPYRQNVLTLAMDLYHDRPLGLMGYDGCTRSFIPSEKKWNMQEYLEDVFFHKTYSNGDFIPAVTTTMEEAFSLHDKLLESSASEKNYYTLINQNVSFKQKLKTFAPFLIMLRDKILKIKTR